ncbi:hypothetical protein AB834_03650 [PVC group bacterium (ex Bugula neritina AB1)]|nr:hypothetical protein AB834_03650 [PVC group bacterium (ex Bugula neritina AB1)]
MIYNFSHKGDDFIKIIPYKISTQYSTSFNIFILKTRVSVNHSKCIFYIVNNSNNFIVFVPKKIESINSVQTFYKTLLYNFIKFKRIKASKIFSAKFIIQGLGLSISLINKMFMKISINTSFSFFIFIPSSTYVKSFNMNKGVLIQSSNKHAIEELSKKIIILYKFSIYNSKGIIYQNL